MAYEMRAIKGLGQDCYIISGTEMSEPLDGSSRDEDELLHRINYAAGVQHGTGQGDVCGNSTGLSENLDLRLRLFCDKELISQPRYAQMNRNVGKSDCDEFETTIGSSRSG